VLGNGIVAGAIEGETGLRRKRLDAAWPMAQNVKSQDEVI
jgi:hypothetical protein